MSFPNRRNPCSFPHSRTSALAALLLGGWALVTAQTAWAGAFKIQPIRVYLGGSALSEEVSVKNESSDPQRFQVNISGWEQNPQGVMQLNPTQDVIAFPLLFDLAPGETRLVRLGTRVPPSTSERTYRLFLQQLPPLSTNTLPSQPSRGGASVSLLLRAGIPIFVVPLKTLREGRLENLVVQQGKFSFEVHNTGNVHLLASSIQIKGYDPAGKIILEGQLGGGYILAGGTRVFDQELPQKSCASIKYLSVEVKANEEQAKPTIFTQKLETPNGVCK